ncbi:hypothetical protein LEP1GSC202_3497 [Leptospira yanagawae serovar Saopaulo str. Sao Paulo = ATCC 700523]|uniref:DUF8156 domain-containing protein n=2 Tax=Leptospira yanagawae TaxID=293069 RepID=A0ABY2LX60_9LEPT|nr:hypothetical protein [Leptospira yanagawae]EOQ87981.1 hypothetical protein LEP1GSC202_3497 [Leptospira yanagawae serovar Saopaulo str. Sao Paulo = ATCC 700523]TGL17089.1 hypothetical protein EHQ46_17855 [Leptospira yanagawae]
MGRTISPYSRQMLQIEENLSDFRRALRKADQEIFDDLIRISKLQVQAGVMASLPYPIDSMLLSMMIQLKKELNELTEIKRKLIEDSKL